MGERRQTMYGRGHGFGGRGGNQGSRGRGGHGSSNGNGYGHGQGEPGTPRTPGGTKRKRQDQQGGATAARRLRMGGEEEGQTSQPSQGSSGRGRGVNNRGGGGVMRGQGRNWSIQNAELWGASDEALEFVAGKVGEEQAKREDERRKKMRPELPEGDRKRLEEAGKAASIGEAVGLMAGVFEGAYAAMGEAVGALREETLEWRRDLQAHMASTDRQNRKRHLEFASPALRIPDGATVTEEECLERLSEITEEKYGVRLGWGDVAACHPLGGKNGGRAIALFKNTNQGSPYARLLQPGIKEGGVRGLSSRFYLKVEVSTSAYDATIKDLVHWYRDHVAFMKREARGKGWKEEDAAPPEVYVTRYSHERLSGKLSVSIPSQRNIQVTSAREVLQLVGQRCLDAFIMKVPAHTWITPRKREDIPGPSFRGTGANREPVGQSKSKGKPQQQAGSGRKSEEKKKKGEERMEEEPEELRGTGDRDRDSLAPSEGDTSIWELLKSPRVEERFGGEEEQGSGTGEEEEEEQREEGREESFIGRMTGLFRRSFL